MTFALPPRPLTFDFVAGPGNLRAVSSHAQSGAQEILCALAAEHSGKRSQRQRPIVVSYAATDELRWFASHRVPRFSDLACEALVAWAEGRAQGLLRHDMPTAREMVHVTARGQRFVSLLDRDDRWPFVEHDLCHLGKFVDPSCHLGQVGFFTLLDQVIDSKEWAGLDDGVDLAYWAKGRDRVFADMNGHPIFLFSALKASLIHAARLGTADLDTKLEQLYEYMQMTGDVRAAARQLRGRYTEKEALVILDGHFRSFADQRAT